MALDPSRFLMPITPIGGMDFGDGFLEAQRMKQMRAQLEETRRRNKEDERLRQLSEENEMARARMLDEQHKAKIVADARAALLKKRQTAEQKYSELMGQGQTEAAEAMLPYISSLGSGVEEQGEGRYRYVPDTAEDDQAEAARLAQTQGYGEGETSEQSLSRLGAMGYPEDERGNLGDPLLRPEGTAPTATDQQLVADPDEPEFDEATADALTPGDADMETSGEFGGDEVADVSVGGLGMQPAQLAMGDAYTQALIAQQYAREHGGQPIRKDEADISGSVPNDVIDTGAMEMSTLKRLKPALSAFTEAYPDTHVGSAGSTQAGVEAMAGMPADKRLELYQKMRSGPDSAINQGLQLKAQKEKDDTLSPHDQEAEVDQGARRTTTSFKTGSVKDRIDAASSAKLVVEMLSDDDETNDSKAINFLMTLSKNKGPQTEADAMRMTGDENLSLPEKAQAWIKKQIQGGYWEGSKTSMIAFAQRLGDEDRDAVFNWFDTEREKADSSPSRFASEGAHGVIDTAMGTMPAWMREQFDAREEEDEEGDADADDQKPQGSNVPADAEFQDELVAQAAEADLDPDKMGIVIGPESGGRADAVNSKSGATGIIQFMPSVAKSLGTSPEKLRQMTPAQQLPYAIKYLKDKGITADSPPEDYVMAVAAPAFIGAPPGTVVYKKGSKAWQDNPAWRPADGGDITNDSIAAFYGLGSEGGSAAPDPENDLDAEVLDILR